MKKLIVFLCMLTTGYSFAQDHFVGVNTSARGGIINASLNPAELGNLSKKFDVNISGFSFQFANNIVSISDLNGDTDFEDLVFNGNKVVNANLDFEYLGPSVAMRWEKWVFSFTTKANIKTDIIDVNPNLGDAILNTPIIIGGSTTITNNYNQRVSGTSWGEIGLSAARTVYEDDMHKFNGGLTLKLLFPGSYTNVGMDAFQGTINNFGTSVYLNDADATLNFSYSGNLADSGTNFNDYTHKVFGGLHGFATDLGVNYQWKDPADSKKYKINAGMSLRNIGSMTFSDSKNSSNSYTLDIHDNLGPGLDLSAFENAESVKDIEQVLLNYPQFFTKTNSNKDFKVKLPTTFSIYGDFKIYTKFFITGQLQQKLQDNNGNKQITALNSWSIIPRVNLGFFEAYIPFSHNEVSGGNTGLGFRLGGFYMGSGSIVSALINDSKQIDFNMGFRWAFL